MGEDWDYLGAHMDAFNQEMQLLGPEFQHSRAGDDVQLR